MKKSILIFGVLLLVIFQANMGCKAKPDTSVNASVDRKWWKEAVVYQIYPRSFKDSDGDGIGVAVFFTFFFSKYFNKIF